ANALTWTFYLLSEYPSVEAKLYEELKSVLGNGNGNGGSKQEANGLDLRIPTVDDIPNLQYTEKIVRESMRLYPPAWTLGRQAINDYNLDGYLIPAKSIILMSQYVT